MKQFGIVCVFMLCMIGVTQAQLRQGAMGMGACMALPAGLSASVLSNSNGTSGSALGQLNFTFTGGSNFSYMLSPTLEADAGLGIGMVSFGVSSGTAPSSRTTLSLMVGARSFMRSSAESSPYVGGNISYTKVPTISSESGQGSETTGNILALNVFFGAQGFVARNVALYAQMGIGYNSASVSSTAGTTTTSGSVNTLSIGGSAIGINIYWD